MLPAPLQDTYAYDGKHFRARPYVDKARHGTETLSKQLIYTSKLRRAVVCCAYNENKTQHVYACRCMQEQVQANLVRKILNREKEDGPGQRSRPIRSQPSLPSALPHKGRFPYECSRRSPRWVSASPGAGLADVEDLAVYDAEAPSSVVAAGQGPVGRRHWPRLVTRR
jgi:hypothetical protein